MLNVKRMKALITGVYICEVCGTRMKRLKKGEWYCPTCGIDIDAHGYGYSEEGYENLYPTMDEVMEYYSSSDEDIDCYEEVYDLDNND